MKNILLSISLLFAFCFSFIAQEAYFLSPKNKAYLYHTVRKSPILELNIGRYIVYEGPEVTLPNGEVNYDSIEQKIINQPDLLTIYSYEISRSPKGILAELANKMAIWELNQALQSYRSESLVKDGNSSDYEYFESLLMSELPDKALRRKKGEVLIHRRIEKLTNPTLTFKDKVAILDGFGNWTEEEKKQVIETYNKAVNSWVAKRTREVFVLLGGKADYFENILTAAGDGSSTSGLFEEREKDERGRWNRGLPKAVGLFPYEPYIGIKENAKKKKPEVLSMGYTTHSFETIGKGKETNIHLDVWGYNSEKQTTVVIKKGENYYPLFGATDTRFLSPDSTFGGGVTYYSLIAKVKKDINDLEEKISGRRGIEYQIKELEESLDDKKLDIEKKEKELIKLRSSTITTNNKKYKTDSNRKKRKKSQDDLIRYNKQLKGIKKRIKELKVEKENLLHQKQIHDRKLQKMYDRIGKKWVCFEEEDGYYLYKDSTTFNIKTQEFVFPASEKNESFSIALLAMPISHVSNSYDEVMLHINITDAVPLYTSQIQLEINDQFDVDEYELKQKSLFKEKDSIAVMEFFEALLNRKKDFKIIARGGGVGQLKNDRVEINYDPEELNQYPGNSEEERRINKEDAAFKRLRTTEVKIHIDKKILLQVNSFTDPVRSYFIPSDDDIRSFMYKNKLNGNQMLSTYRSYATMNALKSELNILAGKYLPRKKATKVIDRLNKAISKSRISVGPSSVKYKDF